MRIEAKISMSVFAFYLIFGLNELFGVGQRFIVPHILDDIILFIVSIIFIYFQKNAKAMLFPFSFTLLAFFGFFSAPHAATLFDEVVDIDRFAHFVKQHQDTILYLFLASFIFLSIVTLSILPNYLKQKAWPKYLFAGLGINVLILLPLSFYFNWSLHIYAISMFVLSALILIRNEREFTLHTHHYAFIMLHFIASMLTVLEYVSLRGLIAF